MVIYYFFKEHILPRKNDNNKFIFNCFCSDTDHTSPINLYYYRKYFSFEILKYYFFEIVFIPHNIWKISFDPNYSFQWSLSFVNLSSMYWKIATQARSCASGWGTQAEKITFPTLNNLSEDISWIILFSCYSQISRYTLSKHHWVTLYFKYVSWYKTQVFKALNALVKIF